MSAVNILSSLKEIPNDESLKDGSKLEEEECSKGVGGGGDPAVLAVGPARKPLSYTREVLMKLKNSPLSKKGLDATLLQCEALALVLKKLPDTPNDEDRGARGDAPNENQKAGVYGRDRERRSADPRERVRKESEPPAGGIVLSPQRRSFTSGCGAPATRPPPDHTAALPAPKPDPVRRIGSGRITIRDETRPEWQRHEGSPERSERTEREPYRAPAREQARTGDRYDRRSYNRDSFASDMKRERDDRFNNDKPRDRDREDNRRSGGRFNQRRYDKEDEPEWFSGGPTSQLETIELRGFDEPIKRNGTTNSKDEKWSSNSNNNNNNSKSNSSAPAGGAASPRPAAASPPPPRNDVSDASNDKDSGVECKGEEPASSGEHHDFNLDDFLKLDSIPDVLTNGGGVGGGGSRFSRWFRRDSPSNADNKHCDALLHNMLDDLDAPRADTGAAGGAHHFAPISPPVSLLELLRRANVDSKENVPELNPMGGKMHSLEELEGRMRAAPSPRPDRDLAAFKRLLAQVSGGQAVAGGAGAAQGERHHPPQPQPMSLLQMLNKSMEQQQQQQQQAQQQKQQQQQQQQTHIPQELLYKLLQVQQRQQQQDVSAPPPPPPPAAPPADRELLQRPEAQAIIHGLKAGEITAAHVVQQLNNPGLQSRHRELLIAVLRLHQHHQQHQQMGGSPLPGGAPHLAVPPHHQPLRLSPLPHTAFCVSPIMATSPNTLAVHNTVVPARIPSPRELAAHTQSIMQGALIKKKLEEQRENYRRRHEMQTKQHTPISFTPTSVLRKMTAEKESEAPSPKQQQHWAQPSKMPQGRPIVKGNQGGMQPSAMGYSSSLNAEYQHYLSQQQQMPGMRPYPHPQQRQMPPTQMNNLNNVSNMNKLTRGTTLHQLLVQSHQRSLNEMSGHPQMGSGGGDNQLARWFSPELLARAQAGKLPSVHVPNALSLEELERAHHSPAVRN